MGWFPNAARKNSRPSANRDRLDITSLGGVLSGLGEWRPRSRRVLPGKNAWRASCVPLACHIKRNVFNPGILVPNTVVMLPARLCRKRYSHRWPGLLLAPGSGIDDTAAENIQ